MSAPFLGEIRAFAFDFPPKNWAICAGQLMNIQQYAALFSLLGTSYGGDGVRTFGLPDLRSKVGISFGQGPGLPGYVLGEVGGQESVTLQPSQIPQHTHQLLASNNLTTPSNANTLGTGKYLAKAQAAGNQPLNIYGPGTQGNLLNGAATTVTGGAPHENRQPYLTTNYCIALAGIFPSRN